MSQKVIKWSKEWAILIGGCFNYPDRRQLYLNVSFWFHLYCFVDLMDDTAKRSGWPTLGLLP